MKSLMISFGFLSIMVSHSVFAQSDCHNLYKVPLKVSPSLSHLIDEKIKTHPYGNPQLIIFEVLRDFYLGINTQYESVVANLHKQGVDQKLASEISISNTLLTTIKNQIVEIDPLINSNKLHLDKAQGIIVALKTCSKSIEICHENLRKSIESTQEFLREVKILKGKLLKFADDVEIAKSEFGPNPSSIGNIFVNKSSEFMVMAGIVDKYIVLLESQLDLAANALSEHPLYLHRLIELEMRGVDLGILARRQQQQVKAQESPKSKPREAEEFSRAQELATVLKNYPVSQEFMESFEKLKQVPFGSVKTSFEKTLFENFSKKPAEGVIGYENYYYSGKFGYHKRKIIYEKGKGFSLTEIRILFDKAFKDFDRIEFDLNDRNESFVIVNTSSPLVAGERVYYPGEVSNVFLNTALRQLMWGLLARLNHSISRSELDLVVDYFTHKEALLVNDYKRRLDEAFQAYTAKADQEFEIAQNLEKSKSRLSKFFGQNKSSLSPQVIAEKERLRQEEYDRLKKEFQTRVFSNPDLDIDTVLATWEKTIETEKNVFFHLLVQGLNFPGSYIVNTRIYYPLTLPRLNEPKIE